MTTAVVGQQQDIRSHILRTTILLIGAPLSILAGTWLSIGCGALQAERRPNVVLITLDTFRADVLGSYGSRQGLTPSLDHFAEEATLFENAVTPMGTTFPAHASLFTGLYPRDHGVRWNGDRLDARFTTLAERLRDAGYETAAFVGLPSLLRRGGLDQGFGVRNDVGTKADRVSLGADEVNRTVVPWLLGDRSEPLFVWIHYFDTHSPYPLTPYARRRFASTGYRGPLANGASTDRFYSLGREISWTEAERQALLTLYEGAVQRLDQRVGALFKALRRSSLLAGSVVIVAADHGQALGEHDVVGHGFLLWQSVIHVPLMIRLPDGTADGPRRVADRVGLIDVVPTVLELVGLPPARSVAGRTLVPTLRGRETPSRPYFVESRALHDNRRWSEREAAGVAVLLGDAKAIWKPSELAVFDLRRDPLELNGSASAPTAVDAQLKALIDEFRARPGVVAGDDALDPYVERELRALGYLR